MRPRWTTAASPWTTGDGRSGEKFYDYVGWIEYLIANFLKPWGYVLNGEVEWHGEDGDDRGMIVVKDNVVSIRRGQFVYDDSE